MDKLSALDSFVAAVRTGTLSGAAARRGVSQPAVSQQIAALEALYGTRLLTRSRNGVKVTEAGALVLARAEAMLAEEAQLAGELEALTGKVAGPLTVTANMGLSQHVLSDVIVQLARAHPEMKVLLRADDELLDLAREGIDLAIRSGSLGEGSGVARKFGSLEEILVANPAYLDAAGRPRRPEDLARLDYIQYRGGDGPFVARLMHGAEVVEVPIKVSLTAQLPDLVVQALASRLGFAKGPRFVVADAIAKGDLEVILPHWKTPPTDLYLVTPSRDTHSPRVKAFLLTLFGRLQEMDGASVAASAWRLVR